MTQTKAPPVWIVAEEAPDPLPDYTTRREKDEENALIVEMKNVRAGWEQYFLFITDAHWDNPHCRRDLFKKFMNEAQEKGAGVVFLGDFFCAMQSKNDRRGGKSQVRPEHQVENYFGSLIDTAYKELIPYKSNILMMSYGNHETSVLRHAEIDLLKILTDRLGVEQGGYAGFLDLHFSRGNSNHTNRVIAFHHGTGGGGIMTKGVMNTAKLSMLFPDADIILSGHVHERLDTTFGRQRYESGRSYTDNQRHIIGPTLKDEFSLQGGYHLEKGRHPKPLGATWIRFYYDTHARGNVNYQVIWAE
jgi:predicted phosphodiesterase